MGKAHMIINGKETNYKAHLPMFPGIRLQEPAAQWPFKLSYYVDDNFSDDEWLIFKFLDDRKLSAKVLLTENHYLDLLPVRASKGTCRPVPEL